MTSFAHTVRNAARNASVGGLALFYTALTFGVATAPAPAMAFDGHYYRAEFAQPVEAGTQIIRGTPWACEGNVCVANKGNSRPVIMCQRLNKKVDGELVNFTIEGEALEGEKLAKCQGK